MFYEASKALKQSSVMTGSSSSGLQMSLTELNPHFVCVLCFGYFVDATTITECMHTFCKSCIVNFLSTNHHCPHCDTLLSRSRTLTSLRPDRIMQALVYKTVPGLFQTEMRRRINFYDNQPNRQLILSDYKNDVEDQQNYVFSSDDYVSLVLQHSNFIATNGRDEHLSKYRKYLRCPATIPVRVLKLLIKIKHHIPDSLRVELLYGEERLLDSWTLMEVAYIFKWPRVAPMELSFQIFAKRKVKKKKLVVRKIVTTKKSTSTSDPKKRSHSEQDNSNAVSENCEPTKKCPKLIIPPSLASPEDHPRPPTPPETPEQILHDDQYASMQNGETSSKPLLNKRKKNYHQRKEARKEHARPSIANNTIHPYDSMPGASIEQETPKSAENQEDSQFSVNNDATSLGIDVHPEVSPCDDQEATANISDTLQEEMSAEDRFNALQETPSHTPVSSLAKTSPHNSTNAQKERRASTESICCAKETHSKPKPKSCSSERVKCKKVDASSAKPVPATGDNGVLDLSHHARIVRAKKGDDINPPSPSSSPPTAAENTGFISAATRDSGLAHGASKAAHSATGAAVSKGSRMSQNNILPAPLTLNNNLPLGWTRPAMLSPPAAGAESQTTAFRDLVTLSHAAVQLQIAMAHAQAQAQVHVQAQKMQENVLKKLKASESLSFVNGSGDTLTISPIAGTKANGQKMGVAKPGEKLGSKGFPRKKSTDAPKLSAKPESQACPKNNKIKEVNKANGANAGLARSPSRKQLLPTSVPRKLHKPSTQLATDNLTHSKLPAKVNAALKFKSLLNYAPNRLPDTTPIATQLKASSIKTIIPKSALSSLKIPLINIHPCKNTAYNKLEKDKRIECGRSGDEVFKITNQKLIECLRQQHHNNKLRNSTSPKSSCSDGCISPTTKIDTDKTSSCLFESIICSDPEPASDPDPMPLTVDKIPIATPIIACPPAQRQTLTIPTAISSKPNQTITPLESSSAFKVTNSSCFGQTTIANAPRATNTSIRQIPNPSRLHQQSVSRLSLGAHRPLNNGKRSFTSTGDRLESLTRTLHEKVAASAAGIVSPLAR